MLTKYRKSRFTEKPTENAARKLTIRRTMPDLNSGRTPVTVETMNRLKLTKLLLNVTVQQSIGPVQVLMSPESTVGELIAAVLRQYSKEGRRPVFSSVDSTGFDLHYSQFSFERLSLDQKLNELGTRNFFLCPKQAATDAGNSGGYGGIGVGYGGRTESPPSISTCSEETAEESGGGAIWLRFMEFVL